MYGLDSSSWSNLEANLQTIFMSQDLNLDGQSLTDATNRITTGIDNLDQGYGVYKAYAYNQRHEEIAVVRAGTGLSFGTHNVQFSTTTDTDFDAATDEAHLRVNNVWSNGALVNLVAANDISFEGSQTVNGVNFIAGGTLNFANAIIGTNVAATGNITNLPTMPTITLGDGTVVTAADNTEIDWSNVILPVTGTVQIDGNNVQVFNVPAADQGRILLNNGAFTGSTFVNPIINTVTVPAPANGRVAIRAQKATGGDVEVMAPQDITQGTPISFTITDQVDSANPFRGQFAAGDTITFYVKYDSTVGGTVYQEQVQTLNFGNNGDTLAFNQTVSVANTLTEAGVMDDTVYTITGVTDGTIARVSLTNPNADAIVNLTNAQTLGGAIQIGNLDAVFDAWYGNRATRTTPSVEYGQGNISSIAADVVTLQSGNRPGTPVFIQHSVLGWIATTATAGDTLIQETGGLPEITNQTPGLAIVPVTTIIAGVDASMTAANVNTINTNVNTANTTLNTIDGKVDTAATENAQTQRGVGYLVSSGSTTDVAGTKLGGIKPKTVDYDSTTSFEDIL